MPPTSPVGSVLRETSRRSRYRSSSSWLCWSFTMLPCFPHQEAYAPREMTEHLASLSRHALPLLSRVVFQSADPADGTCLRPDRAFLGLHDHFNRVTLRKIGKFAIYDTVFMKIYQPVIGRDNLAISLVMPDLNNFAL